MITLTLFALNKCKTQGALTKDFVMVPLSFAFPGARALFTSLQTIRVFVLSRRYAGLTICLAFKSSSHKSRFEAMPELDAMQFLKTRKES